MIFFEKCFKNDLKNDLATQQELPSKYHSRLWTRMDFMLNGLFIIKSKEP